MKHFNVLFSLDIHSGEDWRVPGQYIRSKEEPRHAGDHGPGGGGRQQLYGGWRPLTGPHLLSQESCDRTRPANRTLVQSRIQRFVRLQSANSNLSVHHY